MLHVLSLLSLELSKPKDGFSLFCAGLELDGTLKAILCDEA
jgi:hypothetical protein